MHILFLTDNFPPEVNAPASRTFEHCREWVAAGHQVTVVTCAPNFPKGKVFDGYRNRLWQSEQMSGFRVIRVWSYITANEGFARRIADYVSYMVSAILAAPFIGRPDIVIGTSPQFFTACAAYVVSRIRRIPFVFELRDLWPESIRAVGAMKGGRALDWLERLELFLYRKADLIVSVTASFRGNLGSRGVDVEKIEIVTNGADLARFKPQDRDANLSDQLGLNGCFVVGYIGTHGMAHALGTVLDAAEQLAVHPDGANIRFLLLGDGAAKADLQADAARRNLSNVIFVDTVSKDQVVAYWSLLDVALIHLKRNDLFRSVIPSKLFECMAMGIPVAHGVEGESADIVTTEEVGLVFEPENPAALVDCVIRLNKDGELRAGLSRNGPRAAQKYDRSYLASRMLTCLTRVAGRRGNKD